MGFADVETGTKIVKETSREPLGEDVRKLRACGHVENSELAKSDTFTDEVQVDLNMLRPLMLHGVARHVDGADVVAVDHGSSRGRLMKLAEQLA